MDQGGGGVNGRTRVAGGSQRRSGEREGERERDKNPAVANERKALNPEREDPTTSPLSFCLPRALRGERVAAPAAAAAAAATSIISIGSQHHK